MTKAEAYWILEEMRKECFSADYAEALGIAQETIEFVDLMPKDMCRVVFCADCDKYGDDEECPLLSMMSYTAPSDHCSCAVRKYGE